MLLFYLQRQCKPNAESSLYAEVQPVFALFDANINQNSQIQEYFAK